MSRSRAIRIAASDSSPLPASAGSRVSRAAPAVVILSGPASAEDRIYFDRTSAAARSSIDIAAGIERLGASTITMIDITETPRWYDLLEGTDLVIINLHGSPGEDGTIQGLLRTRSIPFLGSDLEASVLALNKYLTKLVARDTDVPTPRFTRALPGQPEGGADLPDGGDRIWKPLRGGSSLATHVLPPGVRPSEEDEEWLVEEFLDGVDVTVAVVEVEGAAAALPAVVLRHGGRIYDLDTKVPTSRAGSAVAARPPELAQVMRKCEDHAVRMHLALGAAHVSRSDFVIHDGEPFFLELNTMPGLSAVSNVTECAAAAGLDYADLLALVVGAALGDGGYSG